MKTNILWIMCDQYNADCFSWAGHPIVRTPNLDKLAAQGVSFTQAYCQYPQCTPSRISMLTGQYCKTHRQYGFVGNMKTPAPHMFELFHQHGYSTGAFGKLHIDVLGMRFSPDCCSPSMSIDWFQAKPPGHHYGAYLAKHGISYPTHETHGGYGAVTPMTVPGRADIPLEHNLERWTANETIDFISACSRQQQPFLAFCSFERPHKPVNIPVEMEERIAAANIPLDDPETAAQLLLKPRICLEGRMDRCSDTWRTPEDFRNVLKRYFTIIEMIDDEIGRIIAALEEAGIADQTAIVFCADHGDQAGRKRIFDKCLHASSNQICRIPFLLIPPKGRLAQAGIEVNSPVESIDLYRTFCDWAHIDVPAGVEGLSLSPVCEGADTDPHRPAFCESYFRRAVVQDGWRLVHHYRGSLHELYHIDNDPLEYDNLYQQPGHAEKVDDLKYALIAFLTGDFDQADTNYVDEVVLRDPGVRSNLCHQKLHRSGCESGPFFVRGRALHVLEWKHWTLFYRVDTRKHQLFNRHNDPERTRDIFPTPMGRWAYGELRDKLLDCLIEQLPPMTYWEPEPLGAELATPEQVEAYLSQPLFK